MNFGNIVIMMSKFGSKSGDFAQRETLRSGVKNPIIDVTKKNEF